jgi:glycine cleavage system H protein
VVRHTYFHIHSNNYFHAAAHEWALDNGDGTATVGISDYAASALGDAVFCDLPEIGDEILEPGENFGLVESVKAASDIYSPVTGEVVEVNEALEDSPELLNEDPTGKGWIAKFKMADSSELDSLMDEDAYKQFIEDI